MLSWQNILSNRQIAVDIEEKWANQGEVLRRGISPIYLSSSNKCKPCHGAINSRPRNLRTALEKYFRFQCNCKRLMKNSTPQSQVIWVHVIAVIYVYVRHCNLYMLRKAKWVCDSFEHKLIKIHYSNSKDYSTFSLLLTDHILWGNSRELRQQGHEENQN